MRLAYLVHDLKDLAVARRLDMLRPHLDGAVVAGFHRGAEPPARLRGWPAVSLGRTEDARLLRRAAAVLRARLLLHRLGPVLDGATVVMARQLEMLALAAPARDRFAPAARLAYECLDIHRLMAARSVPGAALRRLEATLLRRADLVVVSSPAFLREHFAPLHGARLPPACLVENKVLAADLPAPPCLARPAGPPWRIGWFGMLRCRRSLLLLADLVRRLPGLVEVDLRGRPAAAAIPDFAAILADAPGLRFHGPYDRARDLAAIYGAVHYAWAIDFYEAEGNSRWLLPNRLYEGGLHGAVPIALPGVETGRWLAARGAGLLPDGPLEDALAAHFAALRPVDHARAVTALAAVPRGDWLDEGEDGARLAAALASG